MSEFENHFDTPRGGFVVPFVEPEPAPVAPKADKIDMKTMVMGVYLYGALTVAGLFGIAFWQHDLVAAKFALASAALAYVAQYAGAMTSRLSWAYVVGMGATVASVLLGLAGFVHML